MASKARYCVMFFSQHYVAKAWTKHELKAAQARALNENEEYILPIRLDSTEIPLLCIMASAPGPVKMRVVSPDRAAPACDGHHVR